MDQPPLVIYHHIPKTAGSSARVALARHLGSSRVYWHLVDGRIRSDGTGLAQNEASYDVIGGHFGYRGIGKLGFSRRLSHFALVRDPVELIISAYHFTSTRPDHRNHTKVQPHEPGFIETSLLRRFANIQCRMLGGQPDFGSTAAKLARRDFTIASTAMIERLCSDIVFLVRGERLPVTVGRQNASGNDYKAGFDLDAIRRRLAPHIDEDRRLYEFIVEENAGYFASPVSALLNSGSARAAPVQGG